MSVLAVQGLGGKFEGGARAALLAYAKAYRSVYEMRLTKLSVAVSEQAAVMGVSQARFTLQLWVCMYA